jgi:osmotically inducible lipoprotein OsmB
VQPAPDTGRAGFVDRIRLKAKMWELFRLRTLVLALTTSRKGSLRRGPLRAGPIARLFHPQLRRLSIKSEEFLMCALIKAGLLVLTLAIVPIAAQAGTLEGAAIGAGSGLVIAGPPGAIVGGVIGATVGGPNIVRHRYRNRNCWTNRYGERRCNWR